MTSKSHRRIGGEMIPIRIFLRPANVCIYGNSKPKAVPLSQAFAKCAWTRGSLSEHFARWSVGPVYRSTGSSLTCLFVHLLIRSIVHPFIHWSAHALFVYTSYLRLHLEFMIPFELQIELKTWLMIWKNYKIHAAGKVAFRNFFFQPLFPYFYLQFIFPTSISPLPFQLYFSNNELFPWRD